jgi:alkylated DNA nucleotide flippase Atl1
MPEHRPPRLFSMPPGSRQISTQMSHQCRGSDLSHYRLISRGIRIVRPMCGRPGRQLRN